MKKKRIILYARESTKWQAEEGYNLETQKKRMLAYIDSFYDERERTIEIFEEAGKSAKNLKRPKMEQMLQRIENQTVDVICVYCIDRLTRSVRDLADLLELIQENKVTLLSVTEKIDTSSPQGRFFLNLLGSMAQLERENISERVLRALKESGEQGNYAKSAIPYGYKKNRKTKQLEIDEKKAEIVRKIFWDIGQNKKSVSEVSSELRKNKTLNRTWYDAHIYRIVRNKIYYGTYIAQGNEIENHTIPIVSKEEWKLANDMLYRRNPEKKHSYVYKGFVYCEECNRIMSCTCGYGNSGIVYQYYKCPSCKGLIAEKDITNELNKRMTFLMKKAYLSKLKEELQAIQNIKYETLDGLLTIEEMEYDDEFEHKIKVMKLTDKLNEEAYNLIYQSSYVIRKMTYADASFAKKQQLLKRNIKRMYVKNKKVVKIEKLKK